MEFERREYQENDVGYAMEHGKEIRPIHCAPTGSGKSLMQAKVAKEELDRGNRTAILTPREEIFGQTNSTLNQIVGLGNVGMLKSGEYWRRDLPVHIVSWPTLTTRTRRSHAWYPDVERLIVDEAHLSMAPRILECLNYYRERGTVIDGYTATPARKSGRGLGDFFSNIKHVTSVRQLLEDGKLCPPEYWWGPGISPEEEAKLKKRAGEFVTADNARVNMPLIGDVVDNWLRVASTRHTMVFAADIPHCEALCDRFLAAGITAATLHHLKTKERRAEIDRDFKNRVYQVLVNVSIGSYGYDAPSVDCIVLARHTSSIVFHLQAMGRGMRPFENKPFFMVIDHCHNVIRNGKAEDLYRWRLTSRADASGNWTRDKRNKKRDPYESKMHECRNCQRMFDRSRICPSCGWEVPFPKRERPTIEADVVRMSEQHGETKAVDWPSDMEFYLMLRHHQERLGYKLGWTLHKYKAKKAQLAKKSKRDKPNPDAVPLPPKGWNHMATIEPEPRVASWIRAQQIRFANSRGRKKKRAAA